METYTAQKEDMECISDPGILDIINSIAESRKKYPLPDSYSNYVGSTCGGNGVIMFDDIGPIRDEVDFFMFIPPGIRDYTEPCYVHSHGSKHYGFADFGQHEIALSFMNKFNNLQIPETDLTYKLSWAPVEFEWKAVEFDVPENFEKNKQVGVLETLEMKTLVCDGEEHVENGRENTENDKQVDVSEALEIIKEDYYAEVDKIATALKNLFSTLDDEAHSGTDVSPFWTPIKSRRIRPTHQDDGVTLTLFLSKVDPVIKEEQIMRVFGKYGECQVDLPPGGGWATVTFTERSSVKSAHKALSTILEESCICILFWGIKIMRSEEYKEWLPDSLPCYLLGWSCPKGPNLVEEDDE